MKDKIIYFFKTKGYYMVLALCVLTVGTVSFLSYRHAQQKNAETPITQDPTQDVEKVEDNVPDDRQETPDTQEQTPATDDPAPQVGAAEYSAPLSGEIIAHYSPDHPIYSYTLKDWRTHSGIDIAAAEGTNVLNVCEGVVESVTEDDLMGNMAVVRHTDGKISRYASLGSIAVQEGQMVAKGDPIGTVGKSMLLECGETDHLHYELWEEDKPIDPSFLIG
ncbi:MAG: M23 family metallopeptidase [Clostridia bacterium]|nr:M23 family metallopeptidase [Clostridia bacterium]